MWASWAGSPEIGGARRPYTVERGMKRTDPSKTSTPTIPDPRPSAKSNGRAVTEVETEPVSADLSGILASLQTMRDGDFSVRLPGNWTGLAGKIADTFNDIVTANQQMAKELKRVGQVWEKKAARENACAFIRP